MSSFLEVIWSNSPVLVALIFLFVRIMRLEITMKSEFGILRSEMREGDKNLEHRIEMETKTLRSEINGLRKDMDHGFEDIRKDMAQQGKDIRAEMHQMGKDLRAEMNEMGKDIRTEMKEGFAKRDHEFEKTLTTLKTLETTISKQNNNKN